MIYNWGLWSDITDRYPIYSQSMDCLLPITDSVICTGCMDGWVRYPDASLAHVEWLWPLFLLCIFLFMCVFVAQDLFRYYQTSCWVWLASTRGNFQWNTCVHHRTETTWSPAHKTPVTSGECLRFPLCQHKTARKRKVQ